VHEAAALGGETRGDRGVVDEVDRDVDAEQDRLGHPPPEPEVEARRLGLRPETGPGRRPAAEQGGVGVGRPGRHHHGAGLDLPPVDRHHDAVGFRGDRTDGRARPDLGAVAAGGRRQSLDQ